MGSLTQAFTSSLALLLFASRDASERKRKAAEREMTTATAADPRYATKEAGMGHHVEDSCPLSVAV